jgi:hypothetical protein
MSSRAATSEASSFNSERSIPPRGWQDIKLIAGTTENPAKLDGKASTPKHLVLTGGAPLTVDTSRLPTKEQVFALLQALRPFILQKKADDQRTFLPNIIKLLEKQIPYPPLWQGFRDRFAGRTTAKLMRLRVEKDGKVRDLITEQELHLWLNAFANHRNPKKAARFEEIPSEHVTPEAIRALMLELLAEKTIAILRVKEIVDSIDRGEDFSPLLHDPAPQKRRTRTLRVRP